MKNNFLLPEVRCGFEVSAERKRLWTVILEILEIVVKICDKHHLTYWLEGGSMLGAARHGGIIPWDDDVDIALPRPDYNKLLEILPKELPPYLVMQNTLTSFDSAESFTKVRNSNTACIYPQMAKSHCHCNMGIFLDIFPMDGVPDSRFGRWLLARLIRLLNDVYRGMVPGESSTVLGKIKRLFLRPLAISPIIRMFYSLRETLCGICDYQKSKTIQIWIGNYPMVLRMMRKKSWVDELISVPFEYLYVKIPRCYDEILTHYFGDWHKMVRGGSMHEGAVFYVDRDYKSVLKEDYGYTDKELEKC